MSELESLFSAAVPNPDKSGDKSSRRASLGPKSDKVHLVGLVIVLHENAALNNFYSLLLHKICYHPNLSLAFVHLYIKVLSSSKSWKRLHSILGSKFIFYFHVLIYVFFGRTCFKLLERFLCFYVAT